MTPTYTAIEIIEIICLLDLDELAILGELITEEIERYTIQELSIIHANFFRQVQLSFVILLKNVTKKVRWMLKMMRQKKYVNTM